MEAGPGRAKIVFGAPLPTGTSAERELLDLWLVEALPAWQVREAVERVMPRNHALVELENVWVGAAALSGRVVGADYLVTLSEDVDSATLRAAATRLCAMPTIPRERVRAANTRRYDLRPLIRGISVVDGARPMALRIETRNVPELGSGRPDEVLAALGESAGLALEAQAIVRERLLLAGDEPDGR
jgi:radical SAM-linked protein